MRATANTLWIDDAAHASGGYAPFVSGSDTKYPAPYVLTAVRVGAISPPTLSQLLGVVAKDQMWQLISGVLWSLDGRAIVVAATDRALPASKLIAAADSLP